MSAYFAYNYTGNPFVLYDASHIIALTLTALFCFSFIYLKKVFTEKQKRNFRYILFIILLLDELSWHAWVLYWGAWDVTFMLPLHLCSITLWLTLYMLITKNYAVYEFVYFMGIGGAMQAILTPDANIYGFPHFRAFQTFIGHGLLVAVPIYMTIVEGYRPTLQSFKRVIIFTNLYMIPIFFLNLALGSNYLFIAGKPDFPTLLDALAPWPWYILQLEFIGFAILFILYLPFLIKDLRLKSQPVT